MKTDKYQKKFYRERVAARDLCRAHIVVKETDLDILTDKPVDKKFIEQKVHLYRGQIESYIAKDRRFQTALKPITVELQAPRIVRVMSEDAKIANVGPMAAVAGAIAQFLGRDLLRKGCKEVIIENGGDIFLKLKKVRRVGIYAGNLKIWQGLKIKIKPSDTPLGICTSSGTVGHSLSFGCADSVTVICKSASLADAVATCAGNHVQSKQDLPKIINLIRSIEGVLAVAIIIKNSFASWGKIEFIK